MYSLIRSTHMELSYLHGSVIIISSLSLGGLIGHRGRLTTLKFKVTAVVSFISQTMEKEVWFPAVPTVLTVFSDLREIITFPPAPSILPAAFPIQTLRPQRTDIKVSIRIAAAPRKCWTALENARWPGDRRGTVYWQVGEAEYRKSRQ